MFLSLIVLKIVLLNLWIVTRSKSSTQKEDVRLMAWTKSKWLAFCFGFCFILIWSLLSFPIPMEGLKLEMHKPENSAQLHHDQPLPAGSGQVAGTMHARHVCTMFFTQCVSCFVSSCVGTRHNKEWDDLQLTTASEGAIQRLLKQCRIMASGSEENPFSLAQVNGCLSSLLSLSPSFSGGSPFPVPNSAAESAASRQNCTSKESTVLAFQVKEAPSSSPVVNNLLFRILEEYLGWYFLLFCGHLSLSRIAWSRLLAVRFVVFWRRRTSGPQNYSRG